MSPFLKKNSFLRNNQHKAATKKTKNSFSDVPMACSNLEIYINRPTTTNFNPGYLVSGKFLLFRRS